MSTDTDKTEVGSYFISNYPPYSQWTEDQLPAVREAAMANRAGATCLWGFICTSPSAANAANSATFAFTPTNELRRSRDGTSPRSPAKSSLVSKQPVMGGRPFRFVYFGGGTPVFLSAASS